MPAAVPQRRGSRRSTSNSCSLGPLVSRQHLAGLIMWLPQRDGTITHSELPDGCYQHPVVVLSPQASRADEVVILILTSFGGTNLLDKYPKPKRRRAYLPIYPASPHPDTAAQLFLKKRRALRRETYVNTREHHTVPFSILTPYDRQQPHTRYVLRRDSYRQLIDHTVFVPASPLLGIASGTTTTTPPITTPHIHPVPNTNGTTATTTPTTTPHIHPIPTTSERTPLLPPTQHHHHHRHCGTPAPAVAPTRPNPITSPALFAQYADSPTAGSGGRRTAQPALPGTLPRYYASPRPHGYYHHDGSHAGRGGPPTSEGSASMWGLLLLGVVALGLWWWR